MTRRVFRKIFGAILIIIALVVSQIPVDNVVAEEAVKSDFEIVNDILIKYTGTASTVSVPASVKVIADEAFSNNTELKTLNLPNGLKKISYAAFSGCNNLGSVSLPDTVEELGTAAFCNCTSLSSVSFGKEMKDLGTGVFTGCSKLSSISCNDRFVCDSGVIYDDDRETLYEVLPNAQYRDVSANSYKLLTDYVMPDSVKTVKPYALYGCSNIKSVILSNALKEIPAYSFSYCNSIKKIKIPYAVQNIDMKAFENCVNLEDVTIPASVYYIHPTAFDGCSKLNIIADEGTYAYNWFKHFDNTAVNIIDKEDNKSDVSSNDEGFTPKPIEGLIGETIIVGRQAVFFIDSSDFTVNGSIYDATEFSDAVADMQNVLKAETNGKGLSLPKFTVIGDKITGKAFYGDASLLSYEIPENITSIGDFAFARSALNSIVIPDGVTHIGYGAFYHCDNLSTVSVPATVSEIEASAFEKTRMMDNFMNYGGSDYLIMGDGILVAYRGTGNSIQIPEGVKSVGAGVFKDHKELMEVSLPDSLIAICEDAFSGCVNLRTVTGGMKLVKIEDRAFYNCPINTVRIVDSVKEIGLSAFDIADTSLANAYKTVVFQGKELPVVKYNKTTSRLTNSSYRNDALNGIKVAVVNSENINRVGTVLDRNVSGFSGIICIVSSDNSDYQNGTLKIIDCTLTAREAENFNLPYTVYLYGKGYNLIVDELDAVLSMAKEGAYYEESNESVNFVSFDGSDESYALEIVNDSSVNGDIKEAYKRIYGDTLPGNLSTFEIRLKDPKSGVYLTKFGKQELNVDLPLPDNIPTSNLHIICVDEDNQLEDLPYMVKAVNDSFYVSFAISHTGHYGIYAFNSNSVSLYNLDDSPDTGDYIHPKWFLCIGCLSLGAVLLLYKRREKV